MAWIETVKKADAKGKLAQAYARVAPGDTPLDYIPAVHAGP